MLYKNTRLLLFLIIVLLFTIVLYYSYRGRSIIEGGLFDSGFDALSVFRDAKNLGSKIQNQYNAAYAANDKHNKDEADKLQKLQQSLDDYQPETSAPPLPDDCPTDNPIVKKNDLKKLQICSGWTDPQTSIQQIKDNLYLVEDPSLAFYANKFSDDIQSASDTVSLKKTSPLIGKNWDEAISQLKDTQNTISSDYKYTQYLLDGTYKNEYIYQFSKGFISPEDIAAKMPKLQCPLLSDPSTNLSILQELNKNITIQQNRLATINKNVANIESRYPIQFKVGTVSLDTNLKASSKIKITGDLPNPVLNFTLITPQDGSIGLSGKSGPPSAKGPSGPPGPRGLDGYWGTYGKIEQ
jgi:hypothetical protein